jgi:DNA-binding transcriptional ArsR family regulator
MKELIVRTKEEIRTMTDPYRVDIIQVFRHHNNDPMTVKQIAVALDEPHGKVYYHVKKLLKVKALRLEREEKINGITAKYYVLDFEKLSFGKDHEDYDETLLRNHSNMMVSKFFDDSKKGFIDHLTNMDVEDLLPGEENSYVSSSNLYLNEKNVLEFQDELMNLIEKYADPKCEHDFVKTIFYAIYSENLK